MNGQFMLQYAPMYIHAAGLTLRIATVGVLLSLALGAVCSLIRYYKVPVLYHFVGAYIQFARNTPLLVQLFFLYFGLPRIGIRLSSESCAIIGLSFLGAAYMAESFRSGLEAVDLSQKEGGACVGLSTGQNMRYVIFPQALATAIPAVCANVIFLIKETSVLSAVALADLMYVAKDLIGMYYKTDEALVMLVISYLGLLLPISLVFSLIERRLRYAGFGDRSTAQG